MEIGITNPLFKLPMFLLSREKPFGEKLAAPHKKHFAQEATNNGEETKVCDCEAVML
jgi:hypothetical protein